MDQIPAHDIGVTLLSTSFLVALVFGGIAGKLRGMFAGVATGMVAISAMSLAAAWLTWQAGPQPDRGMLRVEATAVETPKNPDAWITRSEPLAHDELVLRFTDAAGTTHALPGIHTPRPLAVGERILLDYPAGHPEAARAADPDFHGTMLMVFLLFGTVPFLMSLVLFASMWENRPGANREPRPRSPAVRKICTAGRVLANLTLIAGLVVTFRYDDVRAFAHGFPIIGAGAFGHALAGLVAGLKLSAILTYLLIAVGFAGFGLFARSTGITG